LFVHAVTIYLKSYQVSTFFLDRAHLIKIARNLIKLAIGTSQ